MPDRILNTGEYFVKLPVLAFLSGLAEGVFVIMAYGLLPWNHILGSIFLGLAITFLLFVAGLPGLYLLRFVKSFNKEDSVWVLLRLSFDLRCLSRLFSLGTVAGLSFVAWMLRPSRKLFFEPLDLAILTFGVCIFQVYKAMIQYRRKG